MDGPVRTLPFADAGNADITPPDAVVHTVRPRTEADLRAVLREAHANATPVTVCAARTGLAGAGVPAESGLRVDATGLDTLPDRPGFTRMAPFLLLSDRDGGHALVAPGVTLEQLNAVLEPLDLWYPPHPGELRATLGGNVATNASGPRTFAFGSTRAFVRSLRVVLADGGLLELERGRERVQDGRFSVATESGTVLEGEVPRYVAPAVKNAAGLFTAPDMDLVDLFVGSEGLLGVATEIGIRLLPRRPIHSRILFFADDAEALDFIDALRPLRVNAAAYPGTGSDGILALEYFDEGALRLAREAGQPVPDGAIAAVEFECFRDDPDTEREAFLHADGPACVGSLPAGQTAAFRYAVPRRVAELLKATGQPKSGTDFAVPLPVYREMHAAYARVQDVFDRAGHEPAVRSAKWGHIGDGHLHLNFLCASGDDQALARKLYLELARTAVRLGGTLSAEHGVGKKRLAGEDGVSRPYLWYMHGGDGLREIARVKHVFDPKGILNRGNMGVGMSMVQ